MHRIRPKVNRASRAGEISETHSTLRREIEDRCTARHSMRNLNRRRKFVRRVNHSTRSLCPRPETLGFGLKIPAENYRRDTHPGKRTPTNMLQILLPLVSHDLVVRRRSIRLPKWHNIPRQFKPPAKHASTNEWRDIAPDLKTRSKKLEIRAIPTPVPPWQKCQSPVSAYPGNLRDRLRSRRIANRRRTLCPQPSRSSPSHQSIQTPMQTSNIATKYFPFPAN